MPSLSGFTLKTFHIYALSELSTVSSKTDGAMWVHRIHKPNKVFVIAPREDGVRLRGKMVGFLDLGSLSVLSDWLCAT